MAQKFAIEHKNITTGLVEECMQLYPSVLERVYRETRPKLNLDEILKDDTWRYQDLPKTLSPDGQMSKAQLARLVKWKITHGTNRPFLPGMIQKNAESDIQTSSSKAAKLLKDLSTGKSAEAITKTIEAALSEICVLKGVGPATGTLVLSVYHPSLIPFFEDELFHWLVPEYTTKLKYDKKEYKMMLERVLEIVLVHGVEARCLERVSYVLEHSDVLEEGEKKRLVEFDRSVRTAQSDVSMEDASQVTVETQATGTRGVKTGRAKRSQPDDSVEAADPGERTSIAGTRRSKRTRK